MGRSKLFGLDLIRQLRTVNAVINWDKNFTLIQILNVNLIYIIMINVK